MENAQSTDSQPFFPITGTNIRDQPPILSNDPKKLIASKGKGMSPDHVAQKPREQKLYHQDMLDIFHHLKNLKKLKKVQNKVHKNK